MTVRTIDHLENTYNPPTWSPICNTPKAKLPIQDMGVVNPTPVKDTAVADQRKIIRAKRSSGWGDWSYYFCEGYDWIRTNIFRVGCTC
jgi:hypothetical protein